MKGSAQLLASAAFTDTKKSMSIRLVRDLENLGAVFGSEADREKITYSLSVPSENAECAFGVMSQFFTSGPRGSYLVRTPIVFFPPCFVKYATCNVSIGFLVAAGGRV